MKVSFERYSKMREEIIRMANSKDINEQKQVAGKHLAVTVERDGKKVRRNEFCPCGSRKKFKKCCGR